MLKHVLRSKRHAAFLCVTGILSATNMAHASNWVDFDSNGYRVAIRLTDGNVQCASYDGQNCAWGVSAQEVVRDVSIQPLSCGPTHKAAYGASGYDTSTHWCSVAYGQLYAHWRPADAAAGYPAYSVNPDGDVQCFSTDGENCAWDVTDPVGNGLVASAVPLSCGKMHESLYGHGGYSDSTHWCATLKTRQERLFDPAKQYDAGDYVEVFGRRFQHCPNVASIPGTWPVSGKMCDSTGTVAWQDLGWLDSQGATTVPQWNANQPYQTGDTVTYYGSTWMAIYPNLEPNFPPNHAFVGKYWKKGAYVLCPSPGQDEWQYWCAVQ